MCINSKQTTGQWNIKKIDVKCKETTFLLFYNFTLLRQGIDLRFLLSIIEASQATDKSMFPTIECTTNYNHGRVDFQEEAHIPLFIIILFVRSHLVADSKLEQHFNQII